MGLPNFTFKGKEYAYEDHIHNATRDNERGVELALGKKFLEENDNVVEVGAVTPYYFKDYTHPVFDLEDRHPRAVNKDASGMDFTDKCVLSISTVEHFRDRSVSFIEDIKRTAKKYLITFPLGYNERIDPNQMLDKWVLDPKNNVRFMSRIDPSSREDIDKDNWIEKDSLNDVDKKYGTYQWANTIAVIENSLK